MDLTGKQKRHLRGLGHALSPTVALGKEGMTESVLRKARLELEFHELIKVKVGDGCLDPAAEVGAWLATALDASVAQVIGHTVLLYKRRKKNAIIVLPKGDKVVAVAKPPSAASPSLPVEPAAAPPEPAADSEKETPSAE